MFTTTEEIEIVHMLDMMEGWHKVYDFIVIRHPNVLIYNEDKEIQPQIRYLGNGDYD